MKRKKKLVFFTPTRYAKLMGVHVNTVYYWIKKGWLKAVEDPARINSHYLIPFNQKKPKVRPGPKKPPKPVEVTSRLLPGSSDESEPFPNHCETPEPAKNYVILSDRPPWEDS